MINVIGESFENYLDEKKYNKIFEPFISKRLRDDGLLREEKIINQLETKAARESNKLREKLELLESLLQSHNESIKNIEEKLSSTSKLKENQIKDLREKIKSIEDHISIDLDLSLNDFRSQIKNFIH